MRRALRFLNRFARRSMDARRRRALRRQPRRATRRSVSLEALEPRILLAADPLNVVLTSAATDVTLRVLEAFRKESILPPAVLHRSIEATDVPALRAVGAPA